MNTIQKRFLLFLGLCIPSRIIIALLSIYDNKTIRTLLILFASIIVIGWTYIYITKSRQRGGEVFGEKIWWNQLRPVHAFNYLLFIILSLRNNAYASVPLIIDPIIGLLAFINYHYKEGNFKKLYIN